jgi:hypothetical protein
VQFGSAEFFTTPVKPKVRFNWENPACPVKYIEDM